MYSKYHNLKSVIIKIEMWIILLLDSDTEQIKKKLSLFSAAISQFSFFFCVKILKHDKLELTGRFLCLTDQEFTFSVEEDIREYLKNKYQVKDCSSSKQIFDNKRWVFM